MRTRRRSSYSGSGLRLLIISAFALVVIAAVVLPIANFGSTTFHIPSFHVPTVTPTVNPPTTSAPTRTTTVTTHNPAAYLTASGLAAGLAHIRGLAPGARVSLVRVASDSLIATAGLPNGRFKEIVLQPSGQFVISEPNPGERLVPFAEVRPSAVARIVAAMRSRYHVPASRIDYIVLSSPTGAPTQWIAFTKAPGHPGYSATLSGTHLTRLP